MKQQQSVACHQIYMHRKKMRKKKSEYQKTYVESDFIISRACIQRIKHCENGVRRHTQIFFFNVCVLYIVVSVAAPIVSSFFSPLSCSRHARQIERIFECRLNPKNTHKEKTAAPERGGTPKK